MAKMYRTEDFKTPECRVFWSKGLFEKRTFNGKSGYSTTLVFPKTAASIIMPKMLEVVDKEWGDKGRGMLEAKILNNPLLDGAGPSAKSKDTGDILPGYGPDVFFIRTTRSEYPPVVRFRDPNIPATEEEVYSGCYGFAVLAFFAYPKPPQGNAGVGTNLVYFQKTREGEKMAGGPPDVNKYYEKIADTGEAAPAGASDKGAASLFG